VVFEGAPSFDFAHPPLLLEWKILSPTWGGSLNRKKRERKERKGKEEKKRKREEKKEKEERERGGGDGNNVA